LAVAVELPSGTVTFLFTDLEASTRSWEEHGAAMSAALERHDALLREAVERHDGHVVKMTGDGTHAVFGSAPAALRAACDAQRAMSAQEWGEIPLRVRMALHTGVAEERDRDYFGPTVNRAARLMSIGHGGQVLVSQSTESIVRDVDDVDLIDLGEHRLRDLLRPERVFQMTMPGGQADFPPLRSLDVLPTNLPVQLTTFIGRQEELARTRAFIGEHRTVTITGVGGVGKTRLALQVAGEMVAEFADGAWLCELAAATDAESMVGAVASTFGIQGRPGITLEDTVVEFFRPKEMLWVLDNCEHLIEPAARLVDRVVRESPRVHVLATSREALDVEGERTMPLRSMRTASSDDLDSVSASDATRLFIDRSTTARAGFALDASNAAAVNTICRRLDGIPLAIELAAVRVVSMTPAEIAALLDERFRLLTGGRRVALERHQTLRAAVEWSYELLSERERAVFARLAVFASSFDGAAGRAVVTDGDVAAWDVIDALDSLVRKSLVIADDQAGGGTRYQMLETLRQYARDRLDEDDETDTWRRRHAEYYADLAAQIGAGLLGPDEFEWRTRLELELDNIKAATSWAIDRGDASLAMRLIEALADEVLNLGVRLGQPATRALHFGADVTPEEHEMLLTLAAHEAWGLGDVRGARELAEAAVTRLDHAWDFGLPLPLPYRTTLGGTWGALTTTAIQIDAMDAVMHRPPASLELSDSNAARRARGYCSISSYALQIVGDLSLARQWAESAYELASESRNPSTIAQALFVYGMANAATDPGAALAAYERCIEIYPRTVSGTLLGGAHYLSGLLHARRGDRVLALRRLREAIEIMRPGGRNSNLDGAFGYGIEILVLCEAPEDALVLIGSVLGGALQTLREMPLPPERTTASVRELRDTVGRERFDACIARGKEMTYDELISWLLEELDELE
jgi:predicted ATPase/class 3 adenylate cyclase